MSKLSEQVEQLEQDVKYWKKQNLFNKNALDKAYDTINEQQTECNIAYLNRTYAEDNLVEVYEALVGEDGINRYTQDEIIDRCHEYYDAYEKLIDVQDECNLLANENENMANFLDSLDYSQNAIDNISNGFTTTEMPNKASQYLLSNNIEQRETIRELRRKLTRIENICNDTNEEEE